MEQSGKTLSMLGSDRWKGGVTHNGSLLKLHDNSLTVGYSKLTPAATVPVKFGFGAFYEAGDRDNKIYANGGGLTASVFAGILIRQVHIATGYPAKNDQIDDHNKGLLCKQGYVVYKTGFNATTGAEDQAYANVQVGFNLHINNANGRPHFAAGASVAGHTRAGKIVALNPDDSSWTVRVEV
jgi:hypothetical protein